MPSTLPAASSTGLLTDRSETTSGQASGIHIGRFVGSDAATTVSGHSASVCSSEPRIVDEEIMRELVAVERPATRSVGPAFRTRCWWEGVVQSVDGHEFIAVISDRTDTTLPDEEAVFEIEEVSPPDRHLIAPGAVFYLFVGTELSPARQQRNVTIIKLRRLPAWTTSALRRADARAQEVRQVLGLR